MVRFTYRSFTSACGFTVVVGTEPALPLPKADDLDGE
jgi:hypothetical protein